jgi:hypothetical protein
MKELVNSIVRNRKFIALNKDVKESLDNLEINMN